MTTFVTAFVVALAVTPLVVALVHRWQLIDVPNHRSSHSSPVPRGGGLSIAVACVVALAVDAEWSAALTGLVVGALVLGATGLVDDRYGLPAAPRLFVQLLTPTVVGLLVADRSGLVLIATVAVAAVVAAGYVNAFNFMDGINGIAGSQAAIAGAFLALVADHVDVDPLRLAGWAVCGAALGFLPFNAVRARIFLGDVGSYFVGSWLVGLALLLVDAGAPPAVVVGPFLLYLLDTSTVLVRRARRGDALTEAHREHAYQLLTQAGWSHLAVSALCAAIAAACGALTYATIDSSVAVQLLGVGAGVVLVAGYLALPASATRRSAIGGRG